METLTKRLSLDEFKAKVSADDQQEELQKITGGVLGSCHSGLSFQQKLGNTLKKIWGVLAY